MNRVGLAESGRETLDIASNVNFFGSERPLPYITAEFLFPRRLAGGTVLRTRLCLSRRDSKSFYARLRDVISSPPDIPRAEFTARN